MRNARLAPADAIDRAATIHRCSRPYSNTNGTDAEREWAYDRNSSIGRLDKALEVAKAEGWTVVDMKNDWKTIFPFGSK